MKIFFLKKNKSKIFDWIDDNILYYIWHRPSSIFRTIRYWFHCNWNKEHWRLLKSAFTSYGWDGGFLSELEERQIDKALKWFEHHKIIVDDQYNELVRSLRWAKYLIHVINNETDLFHYEGEMTFDGVEGHENLKEINTSKSVYHYDGPYINKKNLHRFLNKAQLQNEYFMSGKCDNDIYLIKAKYLYYKIRERYTDYWWD
jgi:hypothetical protein